MSNIKRISINRLRNAELLHFGNQIRDILLKALTTDNVVISRFVAAANAFEACMGEVKPDALSLEDADAVADRAWSALNYQIQASIRDMREEVSASAHAVLNIFEKTPNPTLKNYTEEYGAIKALLDQLATLDAQTLEKSKTSDAIAQLQLAYDNFVSNQEYKRIDTSNREVGVRKAARQDLISSWSKLVAALPILFDVSGDDKIEDAIRQINVVVDTAKSALNRRANADAQPSDDETVDN